MTIANGFLIQSCNLAATSIAGAISFSLSHDAATIVAVRSDGELYERATPIIPGNATITVETRDLGATLALGASGTFSIVAGKMTGGVTIAGTITVSNVTSATCTVVAVERGTDINGATTVRYTARINSADGSAVGYQIVSA